jgi:HEPN domain-containing protein/predicted nucleotidyltransferase
MIATLDEIRDRIVRFLDPDSIILFGSRSSGEESSGSDVDILIVKDTPERPADRRMTVERLLADRELPLDIFVYTPDEMRRLFALGSPFIHEVVETGRVLYMRKATDVWLQEAEDELESARILAEHARYRGSTLHSRQSVERCLKAMILEKGETPQRTHDLLLLRAHAERLSWKLQMETEDAVFLYSVYKDSSPSEEGLLPHGEPTAADAARAIEVAGRLLASARATGGIEKPG